MRTLAGLKRPESAEGLKAGHAEELKAGYAEERGLMAQSRTVRNLGRQE